MKKLLLFLCLVVIAEIGEAQSTRYIVRFRDKGTSPYAINNPSPYLSARAISRRTTYSIPIDSTDLPVTPRYVDSLRLAGNVTILNVSRWLNQVSIQTTDAAALSKINGFPFVLAVATIAPRINPGAVSPGGKFRSPMNSLGEAAGLPARVFNAQANFYNYGQSFNQVHMHFGEFLHNIGLRGQNMVIAMHDGGFQNYTTLPSFDSINTNGQVLGTWDFVNREVSVVEDDAHGMQCLSTIAANIPGQFVGSAPKASFYLFRSEHGTSEYPIEEHNWVCAAERADSSGADLISSSLGYSTFDDPSYNHTYAEMNGNTTMVTRGADLAAKKGILVVNSAGNEGNSSWKYIAAPADGDSVLAVGAVNAGGSVVGFSSYGPSSDGQVKPDVASQGQGTTIQGSGGNISAGNGTSFAAPNMAGLVACLWQGFPNVNNMRIINALRQAGSIASAPNDRIGYGIPDMRKATMILLKEMVTSSASVGSCKTSLSWTSKDYLGMKYEIERKLAGESFYTKVGEVAATGTDFRNTTRSYTYGDTLINVQAGGISYRIRQVLDTASASFYGDYIDTVDVTLITSCITTGIDPVPGSESLIRILPNPAHGQFTLQVKTQAPVPQLTIRIVNAKGQLVSSIRKSKPGGPASFDIPIHHLASGKYFVSVYDGQKLMATRELVKL
jgi:serine protease AprX